MTSSNTCHPITFEVTAENYSIIPFFASSNRGKTIYKVIERLPQDKKNYEIAICFISPLSTKLYTNRHKS